MKVKVLAVASDCTGSYTADQEIYVDASMLEAVDFYGFKVCIVLENYVAGIIP